jgi:all-trans-retinol 13,14-reductase
VADYDAIVIGSGAGGLSSALCLARNGTSVLLLEAMPSFGGYLNPFRRGSYKFDTGLHYLGELGQGERFWRLLDVLGIAGKVPLIELNPEGFDRYVFPGYEFVLCKGKERFRERLIKDFPREERGIHRFFQVLDKVSEAMGAFMSMEDGPLQMLGFLLKHPVMLKYSRIPYQKFLDEVTQDPRLQAVFAAPSGTYALPPARASVLIAVMVWTHYLAGAYYPQGGSGALRDALVDALQEKGVAMKNRSRVSRIAKTGNEFTVEVESGEVYSARVVMSDVDPSITLGELADPQMVPSRTRQKAQRLRPSVGAFYAFVGTDLDLPSLGVTDASIHHYESFDVNEIYEALGALTPQERVPYCFVTSPSVKDPQGGHAPQDRHTVEIFTWCSYSLFARWAGSPSRKRGDEYGALKEEMGERVIAAAEKHIPDLSKHLECVEYATPLSNEYWVNAVKGGSYGPEETPDQMGLGRFGSFTAGIDGLFLVGAGTLGGGIMPCLASGILAGGKAIKYLGS